MMIFNWFSWYAYLDAMPPISRPHLVIYPGGLGTIGKYFLRAIDDIVSESRVA
jgi:hypothetical protein